MARMFPPILDPNTESSAERRLYEAFARELDDEWVVFHRVKWLANDDLGRPRDGEADFVVAHPNRGILVIEAKGGQIRFDPTSGRFISTDRDGTEHDIGDPFEQAMTSKYTLIGKLRATRDWPQRRIIFGHAVAFPDAVVEAAWLRPNAPREIIINALDLVSLAKRLQDTLNYWRGQATSDAPPGQAGLQVLVRTLAQADRIRHPLLAESARADEQALVQLTEKQVRYLRFLKGHRRAAIAGCAGSGKTFLAVEKACQLAADGYKVLLTCFNRVLADHLGETLGYRRQFDVFNFHQLCVHWANQAGQRLIYREDAPPEYFNVTLPNALLQAIDQVGAPYDAIIVDEGQDFRPEWWEVLPWLLRDPTNDLLYVFFDDNQRVYRDRSAIPIEVEPYPLDENCRNTQRVFERINSFYSGLQTPIALGPTGQPVEIIAYTTPSDGTNQLRRVLHRLLNESGFTPEEIAVLTSLGVERSQILGQRLGNIQLTDRLPLAAGEVFATTVRRFKGLERPVIVLSEVDGRMLPEEAEALMYVGTSRAKTYLVILVGQDALPVIQTALRLSNST